MKINLNDIIIRTELRPGDLGYIIHLHGSLYKKEYNYGIEFESYVAEGLSEFYQNYNRAKERVWICEHKRKIIGFLLLKNRNDDAQLRYFLILPAYRGIGLGSKLMDLYMKFLINCRYKKSFLWTTKELTAAAHLYQKAGFKLTEEKETNNFGKRVTEQKYELEITY